MAPDDPFLPMANVKRLYDQKRRLSVSFLRQADHDKFSELATHLGYSNSYLAQHIISVWLRENYDAKMAITDKFKRAV